MSNNLILRIGEARLESGNVKTAIAKFQQASNFAANAKMLRNTLYETFNKAVQLEEKGLVSRIRAQRETNLSLKCAKENV